MVFYPSLYGLFLDMTYLKGWNLQKDLAKISKFYQLVISQYGRFEKDVFLHLVQSDKLPRRNFDRTFGTGVGRLPDLHLNFSRSQKSCLGQKLISLITFAPKNLRSLHPLPPFCSYDNFVRDKSVRDKSDGEGLKVILTTFMVVHEVELHLA